MLDAKIFAISSSSVRNQATSSALARPLSRKSANQSLLSLDDFSELLN